MFELTYLVAGGKSQTIVVALVRRRLRRRRAAAPGRRRPRRHLLPHRDDLPRDLAALREPDADGLQAEMNDAQWESLCARSREGRGAAGRVHRRQSLAAQLARQHILDYFSSDEIWFECESSRDRGLSRGYLPARLLGGVWACAPSPRPSARAAPSPEDEFPFAKPTIRRIEDIDDLEEPDPAKDGLLPFVLKRIRWALPRMAAIGIGPAFRSRGARSTSPPS